MRARSSIAALLLFACACSASPAGPGTSGSPDLAAPAAAVDGAAPADLAPAKAACTDDDSCGDGGGACDVDSGACKACAADADCLDPGRPRCHLGSGRCVACLPEHDNCGTGRYCSEKAGVFTCALGCTRADECMNADAGGGLSMASCCNHLCVDTSSDNASCGACGMACGPGTTCCSSTCADVTADPKNCGACGKACSGPHAELSCKASKCVIDNCSAGYADCDKLPDDGCETAIATDPTNCGACGAVCVIPHGKPACAAGKCAIASCDAGFADCNHDPADGCEVDLGSTVTSCGACGKACPPAPHATSVCAAGSCALTCAAGHADCDKQYANGCEADLLADPATCGGCGMKCPPVVNGAPTCVAGSCGLSCKPGFANCSGKLADGCSTDLGSDVASCGACGKKCPSVLHGTAACAAGKCGIGACDAGWANCDGNPATGCNVSIATDVKSCGSCGHVCPNPKNGSPACTGGVCGVGGCGGSFQHCTMNPDDGCETDTSTDVTSCGGCGKACAKPPHGTASCSGGVCGIASCDVGYADCDGSPGNGCEVDLRTSNGNCGACGVKCSVGNGVPACTQGNCSIGSCLPGFTNCDGQYASGCNVVLGTDVANCGACGHVCAVAHGAPGCAGGVCRVASCDANYADCDKLYSTGCEANLLADAKSCGSCGTMCGAVHGSAACQGGACAITSCDAPYANCSGSYSTGCETNLSSDPKNCGACGNACSSGKCAAGKCSQRAFVIGTPEGGSAWNNDIASKLLATGAFTAVDTTDPNASGTPSVAKLKQYDAVLVYSDFAFNDPTGLGNNLATYFDGGGRVVLAVAAGIKTYAVGGKFGTVANGYLLQSPNGAVDYTSEYGPLLYVEPQSPLVKGVNTLTSDLGLKGTGGLVNGAVVVLRWGSSGYPLVVRGTVKGRPRADVNFFPVSASQRSDFWNGDGATLLKNALLYGG